MNCLFCSIIKKEIPANVVYESENVIAFLDINPKSKGHTLLVPKSHYKNIMSEKLDEELLKNVKIVVKKLKEKYDFEDFKVVINNGEKAGQEVFHMHIHIIPYY